MPTTTKVDAFWKEELAREGPKMPLKAPVETWANARQPRGTSMPSGQTVSKVNTVFFEGYAFHTKAKTCLSKLVTEVVGCPFMTERTQTECCSGLKQSEQALDSPRERFPGPPVLISQSISAHHN